MRTAAELAESAQDEATFEAGHRQQPTPQGPRFATLMEQMAHWYTVQLAKAVTP